MSSKDIKERCRCKNVILKLLMLRLFLLLSVEKYIGFLKTNIYLVHFTYLQK